MKIWKKVVKGGRKGGGHKDGRSSIECGQKKKYFTDVLRRQLGELESRTDSDRHH